MSFPESVTYIAEFGSLADIFPVSPWKYLEKKIQVNNMEMEIK